MTIIRPVVVIVVNATGGPMQVLGPSAVPMTICSNREELLDATKKGLKALEEREG